MNIDVHVPSAPLRPFIRSYRFIESIDDAVNRVLPETALAIAIRFKGQVNYVLDGGTEQLPASVISGLRSSVRLINYLPDTAAVIILFRETGAASFFKEPLHELFGGSVSLDHLIKRRLMEQIEEELAMAKDNQQRVTIVDRFLLSILTHRANDDLVADAVKKIQTTNGIIKIRELADSLFISHDAFEKRFRKTVGTSPKQFSSIVRMKSILLPERSGQDLTSLAYDAGYFDQPHFNKDFKRFTGLTPTDFYKSPSFW